MDMSDAEVDRMIRGGSGMVRRVIAHEIGQTVIAGFEHAGLSEGDAMYTALQMAKELPYEKLRQKRLIPGARPDPLTKPE